MKHHPITFIAGVAAGIPLGLVGFVLLILWDHIARAREDERPYFERHLAVVK